MNAIESCCAVLENAACLTHYHRGEKTHEQAALDYCRDYIVSHLKV